MICIPFHVRYTLHLVNYSILYMMSSIFYYLSNIYDHNKRSATYCGTSCVAVFLKTDSADLQANNLRAFPAASFAARSDDKEVVEHSRG
ncbi:hypothetical protein SDC9_129895 [bioreactor metagenome]|uniref:Uncharacterized protein n=1 Tax=bioreactor metagenome TaxID=1076179 RepID=A0A645D171_9ZZZZ